jgi:mono/diheme cytochrome c family protein
MQIMNPSLAAAGKGAKGKAPAKGIPDHGQTDAAQQVQKGVLPDLHDMKQGTDQHAKEVDDALKETNK